MLHARLCLGICSLLVPAVAGAQLARGDSLRLLSEARSAQARFERIRQAYSPAADDARGEACEMVQAGDDSGAVSVARSCTPRGVYRVTVAVGADDAHRTEISREIRLR